MIVAQHNIRITDPSHPGEARRAAARLAEKLAFSEIRAGELSIVVMELANNVLTHAAVGRDVAAGLAGRVALTESTSSLSTKGRESLILSIR